MNCMMNKKWKRNQREDSQIKREFEDKHLESKLTNNNKMEWTHVLEINRETQRRF
jgi:hypothetical protein